MKNTSRKSYEEIWNKIINPEINRYKNEVPSVSCTSSAKDDIFQQYIEFNNHCKNTYMANPNNILDRHKVSACYMLAILSASPLSFNMSYEDDILITINEHLAITVGLSILRAFIETENLQKGEKGTNHSDIFLPYTDHGNYRDIFAVELYFTRKEKNYNMLSLSNTLFLLEQYNKLKEV